MEVEERHIRENGDITVEDGEVEKKKGRGAVIDNESMRLLYSAAATG